MVEPAQITRIHEQCTAHAGLVVRLDAITEATQDLRREVTRMRRSLNWLTICVASIAVSVLGADGVKILTEAAKLVSP
jgi:uncharacterized membrane protein (DUF441 family)